MVLLVLLFEAPDSLSVVRGSNIGTALNHAGCFEFFDELRHRFITAQERLRRHNHTLKRSRNGGVVFGVGL